MRSGLSCLSFGTQRRLITSVVYYELYGISMLRPNVVVLIFAISRIQSAGSTLRRTQTVVGISWDLKVGKNITCVVSGFLGGIT